MKAFLPAALFCLCAAPVLAGGRFDNWTTENGLPQNSINAILQTRDGYIWMATFGGLVRYDGVQFTVFTRDNTKGLGVMGYVLKDSAAGEIVAGARAVASGNHYISPALSSFLVKRAERARTLSERSPGLNSLTPSELRVLKLIAEKKTTKQIAAELFVSPRTIDHHRASICSKLDLEGANALLKYALENKSDLF